MHFAYVLIFIVNHNACRFKMHHRLKNKVNFAVIHLFKYAAQMTTIHIQAVNRHTHLEMEVKTFQYQSMLKITQLMMMIQMIHF